MKRFSLLVVIAVASLVLAAMPVAAQGTCPSGFDTGGNGWCAEGIAFRAWQVEGGIELKWVVTGSGGTGVVVERQEAGAAAEPVVVVTSEGVGEFTAMDVDLEVGPVYVYRVLLSGEAFGDPIEAGISATRSDPGDDSGSYRVYIPLAI